MRYSVEEFRPTNPKLKLKSGEIELSLITLHIDSQLKEKVARLEDIFSSIKKNPILLYDILWILVIDKSAFGNSFKKFLETIYAEARTSEVTAGAMKLLSEVIAKSMPLIKNVKRNEELRKIRNLQNDENTQPCFGVYYDAPAKRYGYTIDQFYDLTIRQLHILLHIIGDKSYEEIEIQAALQGRKLKPQMKAIDIDEKVDKQMDDEAADTFARLRREYEENKNKKGN